MAGACPAKFPFHSFNPKLFNFILIDLCSSKRAYERTEKDKEGRQETVSSNHLFINFHSFNPKLFHFIMIGLCFSKRAYERTGKEKTKVENRRPKCN